MIISEKMLKEKVPLDMFPTRFDSATNLYTNTKDGLILYNINPDTWNVLYPFFGQENKFILDYYEIENKDITYQELIDTYNDVYHKEYEVKCGFNEEKRKKVLIDEFNRTFEVSGTTISKKIESHYELKYSKSKNVWTLYYLEDYLANNIDDINKLLSQKVYEQELLSLESYPTDKEINGVGLIDSLAILDNEKVFNLIKNTILQ